MLILVQNNKFIKYKESMNYYLGGKLNKVYKMSFGKFLANGAWFIFTLILAVLSASGLTQVEITWFDIIVVIILLSLPVIYFREWCSFNKSLTINDELIVIRPKLIGSKTIELDMKETLIYVRSRRGGNNNTPSKEICWVQNCEEKRLSINYISNVNCYKVRDYLDDYNKHFYGCTYYKEYKELYLKKSR